MDYIKTAINKAKTVPFSYRICAIGFNRRGEYLGMMTNCGRFYHKGGGIHAEMRLLKKYGPRIRTILLIRVTKSGKLCPIKPCQACSDTLDGLGIKCKTVL